MEKVIPIIVTMIVVRGPYKMKTAVVIANVVVIDILLNTTEKLSVKIVKIPKKITTLKSILLFNAEFVFKKINISENVIKYIMFKKTFNLAGSLFIYILLYYKGRFFSLPYPFNL
jgi:hypothetical protein